MGERDEQPSGPASVDDGSPASRQEQDPRSGPSSRFCFSSKANARTFGVGLRVSALFGKGSTAAGGLSTSGDAKGVPYFPGGHEQAGDYEHTASATAGGIHTNQAIPIRGPSATTAPDHAIPVLVAAARVGLYSLPKLRAHQPDRSVGGVTDPPPRCVHTRSFSRTTRGKTFEICRRLASCAFHAKRKRIASRQQ